MRTNCIDNAKKIWWDIRPHPFFNTIEVRACDIPLRAEETVAIAALIQATAAYLYRLHAANQDFRQYARPLLMENKFRAVRYGLDGMLIDFGKQQEIPERELIEEYLALIEPVVEELGSRRCDRVHPYDSGDGHGRGSAAEGVRRDRRSEGGSGLHGRGDEGWAVRDGAGGVEKRGVSPSFLHIFAPRTFHLA